MTVPYSHRLFGTTSESILALIIADRQVWLGFNVFFPTELLASINTSWMWFPPTNVQRHCIVTAPPPSVHALINTAVPSSPCAHSTHFKSSCIHYAVCKSHTYTHKHKHDITAVKKEDFLLHACRHAELPESICSHSDSEKHTRWVGGRVCEASWRMIGFTLTSTIRHFTYTIQHIHKLNGWMRAAVKWLPPNIHNLMGVIAQHNSGESIFI